ncbi:hypothetical protein ACS5PN_09770 [Roseateles sp. NT4]|uniref:hypothetical protein n=1 Tax=Roseateles sp. NT4 TaxID=3453715 RepID=UPI003EF05B27
MRFAALVLASPLAALAAPCPQFEGSFTLQGEAAAVGDALRALGTDRTDTVGGNLTLSARSGSPLRLSFDPPATDRPRQAIEWALNSPADFRCEKGWLVMARAVEASRGVFEGRSTVRIAPGADGIGLQVEVSFKGRESARIYSYDSAKIDVPLPWSRKSVTERLLWNGASIVAWRGKLPASALESAPTPTPARAPAPSHAPPTSRAPAAAAAESAGVKQARQLLGRTGLLLADVTADEAALRAKVQATPAELARLEDTLRAAGVAYEVPVSPIQTGYAYFVEVVLPQGTGATSQPSRLWVEQELQRFLPSYASVNRAEWRDGAWIAQLGLINGLKPEDALQRLRGSSKAFSEVRVLPGTERVLGPAMRFVDVQLRPR